MIRLLATLAMLIALPLSTPRAAEVDADFPVPASLAPAVQFWKRVYLEVSTQSGFLHDSRRLGVVYDVIRFEPGQSQRARDQKIKRRRGYWKRLVLRLASGAAPRSPEERKVHELWREALKREPKPADYRTVSRRIRFQLGQRDKFRAGLIRSGAWDVAMRDVFRRHGLPEGLAVLPHVESSFNVSAYSKYGAAGVWQFMRKTGRRFMRVDYTVDERLDPMKATDAAARLLKQNYESLRAWPLAITAYNHGAAGMRRAVRRLGTRDIGQIVDRYRSRSFGFASRNFYAQFVAASAVFQSWESHFGPLQRDLPEPVDEVTLSAFVSVDDLDKHLGVAPEVVRHYNPSLRPPVFRSAKRIPRGFVLRLPAGTVGPDPGAWLARLPAGTMHAKQQRSRYYQVRRGDTLSTIARRNRTSVGALVAHNNLPSRHRIYVGQVLEMPDGARAPAPKPGLVSSARAATPPPSPKPKPEARAPAPPASTAAAAKAKAAKGAAKSAGGVSPLEGPTPATISEDSPWRRVNGDWVLVDADETLGHFADWLQVSPTRLRTLNKLSRGRHLRMGQRLRLDFSRVEPAEFLARRVEFHKGIEEDFFGSFRITGTVEHSLRSGESLWILSQRTFGVPIWLIHRFNPDVDLLELAPGSALTVPVIEEI